MHKIPFLLLFLSTLLPAQSKFKTPDSFAKLDSIVIGAEDQVLAYVPKGSKRLDSKLRIGDPIMDDEYVLPVARVEIEPGKPVVLAFTRLPSDDYTFLFFRETGKNSYQHLFSVWGKQLFVPGNGLVYVAGHMNNLFDQRRKYKFVADTLQQVAQPFYYVGLQTRTLKQIEIFSDKSLQQSLAVVPPRSPIEVVAAEYTDDTQYFLIKTSFGLLGWWKLDNWFSEAIEGLFFAGD